MLSIAKGNFNLKVELHTFLATKNTTRHSTTGYILWELHRGQLLECDGKSEKEVQAIITHMWEKAQENLRKAAGKSSALWLLTKKVKIYEKGDRVLVRWPTSKKKELVLWAHSATIFNCKANHTYRLIWGKNGSYSSQEPLSSVSLRCWTSNNLKPRLASFFRRFF